MHTRLRAWNGHACRRHRLRHGVGGSILLGRQILVGRAILRNDRIRPVRFRQHRRKFLLLELLRFLLLGGFARSGSSCRLDPFRLQRLAAFYFLTLAVVVSLAETFQLVNFAFHLANGKLALEIAGVGPDLEPCEIAQCPRVDELDGRQ